MKRTLLVTAFVGVILLSIQVTRAQTPTYREVFGNTTGGANALLSSVGWFGDWGPTATDSSNPSPNNFGISSQLGDPQNLDDINGYGGPSGPPAISTANGLLFTSGTGAAINNWIAYTTVTTGITSINDISFYAGSAADADGVVPGFRIAVQIDGNWYASTRVLGNTSPVSSAANFNSQAVQVDFTWTTAASAWDNLSFTPGTILALGSTLTSPLSGDPVTAFGLYTDATDSLGNSVTATRRVDTYQINTVPEPGSVLLGLFGVGVLMSLRRSRKA
jgi:hypothetical protein